MLQSAPVYPAIQVHVKLFKVSIQPYVPVELQGDCEHK